MEKAILKTLIYADIFDYPLTVFEIHRWLIGRKATLRQIEKALSSLRKKEKIKSKKAYYFFSGKEGSVRKRKITTKHSHKFLIKANLAAKLLKIIPWIKLVGVSGGLAMEDADKTMI